jgi:hypothetical protein
MSLTSYRAAPPRVKGVRMYTDITCKGRSDLTSSGKEGALNKIPSAFGRPGSDLLSRALRRSTIGPGGLNDRVRDGIGWGPSGKVTGVRVDDTRGGKRR